MLKIDNLRISSPQTPVSECVHPFYKDTIKCLFGIDLISESSQIPTRNRVSLVSELRETLTGEIADLLYFLDIRFQEELGSPSPQYEILSDLGLTAVTPICMGGDSAVVVQEGLSVLDSLLAAGEKALCAVSLLSSAKWQYEGMEFIVTFLVESDGEPNEGSELGTVKE